jgi:lactate dehydrogenase-like 2-hydroxyacid dehydrogenase
MTHGFAVRGLLRCHYLIPTMELKIYKPMTTSTLRDAFVSLKAVLNVGVGIEEINGKNALDRRIELFL